MLETAWGFESGPTGGPVGTGITTMRVIREGFAVVALTAKALS